MNLSGEFRNKARCALAITPTTVAAIASVYLVGPSALIPVVISAAIAYPIIKSVSNLGYDRNSLTRIEPSERWKEIASNMGFKKVPPVYLHNSDKANGQAGHGNIVLNKGLMDNYSVDEVDYTFAHELAHIKRADGMIRPVSDAAFMSGAIAAMWCMADLIAFNQGSDPNVKLSLENAYISYGIATGLTLPFSSDKRTEQFNHQKEFDCDERAVLATGNVDAGIQALKRNTKGAVFDRLKSVFDNLDSESHPSINNRIKALKIIKAKQDADIAYLFTNDPSPNKHSRVKTAQEPQKKFSIH